MLLLLFSDPVNGTNYISSVGLSDADNSVIASDAATFATIYNSAVTNYNAGIVPPGYSDPLSGLIGIRDSAVQSAMTDIQNKLSQQGTQDWTTFNAFLTDAQNNEMRTTTGVFQTQSQGSVFAPITGQTGSVASSDSVNSVYLVNTAGNLVRFFPSNTVYATYAGFGNQYVQMVNPDILNNLPN